MIVVDQSDGSLLIARQTDHAQMSADIAKRWHRTTWADDAVWARLIEAVRCHDDGWREPDASPSIDEDGRPIDFKTVSTVEHVSIWTGSIDRAAARHPLTGVLVAMHAQWLYRIAPRDHIEQADVADAFVHATVDRIASLMDAARDAMPDNADVLGDDRLTDLRRLLGFFDGLTLTMLGAVRMPAAVDDLGVGGARLNVSTAVWSDRVTVDPWPFDSAAGGFEVSMPVASVRPARFGTGQAFCETLSGAAFEPRIWRIEPVR